MEKVDFKLSDESLITYLIYFYHYTQKQAKALVNKHTSAEDRGALEDIVNLKRAIKL